MRRLAVLLLALAASACSEGSDPPSAVAAAPVRRVRDPELAEVRAALESYRGEAALALLERVGGFEAECLRARALLFTGDAVGALAALARAEVLDASHPERLATEIECLALLDRLPAAQEALAGAIRRLGPQPELFRAQGVIELRRQGHGAAALEALERARARDPELPFVARPLAQAHLLVGRACLEARPAEATAHAMAAQRLVSDGDSVLDEALELEAEGLAGELRFEQALERLERLESRGADHRKLRATLHQRCATRLLLERARARAVEHYLAARRLGLSDEELGFGADVLREEGHAALARAGEADARGDWPAALAALAEARERLGDDAQLENHLALVRFRQGEYRAAAEGWERALALARARGQELLDPVPLDLAKAWRLAGEPEKAYAVLAELLDAAPDGPWSEDARELLLVLEAEALAGR
ncbi:MAG TPA: hypothetical protein VF530_15325 [Planctomycetota bacterium]